MLRSNILKILSLLLLFLSFNSFGEDYQWITIDRTGLNAFQEHSLESVEAKSSAMSDIAIVNLSEDKSFDMHEVMHHDLNRCAGYIRHKTYEEAVQYVKEAKEFSKLAENGIFADYKIDQQKIVNKLISRVEENVIRKTITKLSSYNNRYYKAETGVESSKWIHGLWKKLVEGRNDAMVKLVNHKNWPQQSIILQIKGSEKPNEIVVIGGHADSIAGFFGGAGSRAPGADDNASGIATISEIIRLIAKSGYKPKRTIMFMGYAAEEVGLLGSKDIAKQFKSTNKDVVGVLQLDMTNFQGSNLDIVMMTDYTNKNQNEFVGKLIDEYLPNLSWGYDRCGYGCSDHASWHNAGYPASMPFESKKGDMNRRIHTKNDTLENMGGTADHASKFAKLGLAFLVEMDR